MIDALHAALLTLGIGFVVLLVMKGVRRLLEWGTRDLLRGYMG